jgi:7-cyano-7-deazaguanine synthase
MGQRKKAVVLLSGGLDSTTALAVARSEGYELYAMTFRYGQRHQLELEAARRVAQAFSVARHLIVDFDLRAIGGSALTDDIAVPKDRKEEEMASSIPVTYVPARNTIFLAFALAWAEVIGAEDIFFGANVLDYSVGGESNLWVRTNRWVRLMPIRDFFELPQGDYQTIALDLKAGRLEWRQVVGRFCHKAHHKRCFKISVETGQHIVVTEDHSLFTADLATGQLITVGGGAVKEGMYLVVASDLSELVGAWACDLGSLGLSQCFKVGDHMTNGRVRTPLRFQVTAGQGLSGASISGSGLGGGLGLSRVVEVQRAPSGLMYDLSVEGAENFLANGFLAHNSGYPDCRPEYIEAFERMANLATKAGLEGGSRFKIHTPLINMTKAEIIRKGIELGVDYSITHSCYDPTPDGLACGRCDSCRLRLKGFAEVGLPDPARYVQPKSGSTSLAEDGSIAEG